MVRVPRADRHAAGDPCEAERGVNAYLKTKAATELFEKLGIQAAGGTAQELKAFIDAELEKWAPIIKAAKIEF